MNLTRRISYQYQILTNGMQHRKFVYGVSSCSIQWASLTQLKSSAKLTMRHDSQIDYTNDRIRIFVTVDGVQSTLGTFLLCSNTENYNEFNVTNRDCECYSFLQLLLDRKLEQTYQVPAGTNVTNEVIRLIGTSGNYSITASNKTLLSAKTYRAGTSYLEVINDLLDTINYTALYTDKLGVFVAKPYVLPQDRNVDFTWKRDINGLIRPNKMRELDLFNVPNVFTVSTNSIDIDPPLTYTYKNTNPSSKTSTVSRGREITQYESVETTSLNDLVAKAKALCVEANSVYEHIEFDKALVTNIDYYMPCGYIIDGKYIIYNISYNCKIGEDMHIKARKAVDLVA